MELTVQQRRPSSLYRRCCIAVLLTSTSAFVGVASVSAVAPEVPPMLRIPAERLDSNVHVHSPLNSKMRIRIARRPWLFDKLSTPSSKSSIKMTPPRPPAAIADPPSMSLVIPENGSGWVTRGRVKTQIPNYADLKINPKQAGEAETPSTGLWAKGLSGADQLAPQTKLQSISPKPAVSEPDNTDKSAADSDVVDTTAANPLSTKKQSKLELKRQDTTKNQSNIGKKSTATLKSTAVIVGEGNKLTKTSDTNPSGDSKSSSAKGETTPKLNTTESPSKSATADSQSDAEMVASDETSTGAKTSAEPTPGRIAGSKPADETDNKADSNGVAETKSPEITKDDDLKTNDVVKVRKLRLQADGTVSDKSGLAENETASLKAEETAKKAPASQFVSSDNPRATKIDYTGRPAEPLKLTRSVSRMRNTIKQGLLYYYARPEAANERSNWGMLHSIMVFGADTKIRVNNRKHSAIAWIAGNNACRGQRLLTIKDDAIAARSGVGLQGHQAQMLAVFSLCDVPLDYPVYASNRKFSVREIVESEMLACRSGEELTFSLIGLSHYLDTDTMWLNADGETWSFERLIKEELAQPIVGAACGGTHRLMGFAHALRKRRAAGKPITGQWKRAEIFMKDFERYAYRLQNRDGSMSTDWFEGREDNGDVDRKIQTTGHMVEWLLTITPDSKLQEPRLVNAVRFLANTIYSERGHDWKIGPKGHALRSLAMYYERAYGGDTAWQSSSMAKSGTQSRR